MISENQEVTKMITDWKASSVKEEEMLKSIIDSEIRKESLDVAKRNVEKLRSQYAHYENLRQVWIKVHDMSNNPTIRFRSSEMIHEYIKKLESLTTEINKANQSVKDLEEARASYLKQYEEAQQFTKACDEILERLQ